MNILIGLVIYGIVCVSSFEYIAWSDRRWYKLHPGANEEFARIDYELTAQGK